MITCFFFCNIYLYYEKYCCFCTRFHVRNKVLSHFLNQKITLPVLPFAKELLSNNIFVADDVLLFVHCHGIMYSARDNHFENSCGNFRVIYYKSVNSVFMICKCYLELLCRIISNNVLKKVLIQILKDFDLNTSSSCRKRSFCSKDSSCCGKERKEIISCIVKKNLLSVPSRS